MNTSTRSTNFTPVKKVIDQLNREVFLSDESLRIVSLVPSQTELLYDLGLNDEVVGITRFCIHPREWFLSKNRVGGTKDVDFNRLRALKPNFIIANKEENTKEDIEALAKEFPVWISDVRDLDSALEMINGIGELTDKLEEAKSLTNQIQQAFATLQPVNSGTVAYLIWKDPWMTINEDTFIHKMLESMGMKNVFAEYDSRYPEITLEDLNSANPQHIYLSSEPYPFREKHLIALKEQFPHAKIQLVDGEMFSWYGSRLLKSPAYFRTLHNN